MKRIYALIAAAIVLLGCSEDRSHILKVYNWADYIDEELLGEFEEWYFEQTGEKVEIIYQTFDINETIMFLGILTLLIVINLRKARAANNTEK